MPAFRNAAIVVLILVTSQLSIAQRDHGPRPGALAETCGSAIPWKESMTAALAAAKESKRPIFWYIPTVPGSPMDRKPEVDFYMRAGALSMPDVVSLISRRCVAVKGKPSRDEATKYGLKALKFIEPGFLILAPDGNEIARLDKISTYHELWLTTVLDRMLSGGGNFGRPSDATLAAKEPLDQAEQHLLDGAWGRAQEALGRVPADADPKRLAWIKGRVLARLQDASGAEAALTTVGTSDAQVELGLLALRREDWAKAETILSAVTTGNRADEAAYLRGVAQHRQGRQPDARTTWLKLAEASPTSRWAARAAAEAEHHAPFSRGFEEYGYLPADALVENPAGTQRERKPADSKLLVSRSVKYLLELQNPDGSYDDSNYDFGGRDSLPDVYVACTALCADALLAWRDVDPVRIDAAVKRAFDYVSDESHIATENRQERVWAHGYRLLFYSHLLATKPAYADRVKAKLDEVAHLCESLQLKKGIFAHEYPNPFASATALHALVTARKSGAKVTQQVIDSGAEALASTRGNDGAFSYGFPGKGDRDAAFAGGRGPICELALLMAGKSDQAALGHAIDVSFKEHAALEAPRKYDDHSPPHRIGGFFFWYDMHARCLAIDALTDAAKKRQMFAKQLAIVTSISEIDGRFIDSHELGKPYGTAMGLMCLKMCAATEP